MKNHNNFLINSLKTRVDKNTYNSWHFDCASERGDENTGKLPCNEHFFYYILYIFRLTKYFWEPNQNQIYSILFNENMSIRRIFFYAPRDFVTLEVSPYLVFFFKPFSGWLKSKSEQTITVYRTHRQQNRGRVHRRRRSGGGVHDADNILRVCPHV